MSNRNSRFAVVCIVMVGGFTSLWCLFWPQTIKVSRSQISPTVHKKIESPLPPPAIPTPTLATSNTTSTTINIPDHHTPLTVDAILTNPALDTIAAARALGTLVQDPTLRSAARAEALAHMLNLSVNHETELLLPLLKSSKLPDSLASTILTDALNRPLAWQAEACLAVVARQAGKALQTQARDHLIFLTNEDHGDDVNAWTLTVRNARTKWEAASR